MSVGLAGCSGSESDGDAPDAEAFVDASSITFVVGSEVNGAMGQDLVAFSDSDETAQFREEWGGDLLAFADVTRETIALLGRE